MGIVLISFIQLHTRLLILYPILTCLISVPGLFLMFFFINKFVAICRASGLLWAIVEYFMIQYHKPSGRQHVLSVKSGGPKAGEESLWQGGQSEWGKSKKKQTKNNNPQCFVPPPECYWTKLFTAFSSASADTHPRSTSKVPCWRIYYIKPACEGLFCMSGSWKNVLLQWWQQLCILGVFIDIA